MLSFKLSSGSLDMAQYHILRRLRLFFFLTYSHIINQVASYGTKRYVIHVCPSGYIFHRGLFFWFKMMGDSDKRKRE